MSEGIRFNDKGEVVRIEKFRTDTEVTFYYKPVDSIDWYIGMEKIYNGSETKMFKFGPVSFLDKGKIDHILSISQK
jgi:hypothetical protein